MKKAIITVLMLFILFTAFSQDSLKYKLRLSATLFAYPETSDLPYHIPSMQQSIDFGNDFYDLSFWGIDALGNYLFERKGSNIRHGDRILNGVFQYVAGAAFSKFGSELPIPLGIWAHEEFHRSVLGVNGIHAENGNWFLSRWDGTVYGVTDAQLATLKENNLPGLLYAYTSGIQSEAIFTAENVSRDVFYDRSFYKNAFYLYNAYYIRNYFDFAVSSLSDSVKVIAPEYEDGDPSQRDFAGADLTAWAYDMFSPDSSYYNRDVFPDGDGVNRRIGFSDLSAEAQDYLIKQKNLSLLNFINPAIFCINKIKIGDNIQFNLFAEYMPTQFGNDISYHLPIKVKENNYLIALHNYNNHSNSFWGMDLGIINRKLFSDHIETSVQLHGWVQPESQDFYATKGETGGAVDLTFGYVLAGNFKPGLSVGYKSAGWLAGNPYLDQQINFAIGLHYNLPE